MSHMNRKASPLGTTPRTPQGSERCRATSALSSPATSRRRQRSAESGGGSPSPCGLPSPCNRLGGYSGRKMHCKPPLAPQPHTNSVGSRSPRSPRLAAAASAAMLVVSPSGDLDFSGFNADEWSTATSPWRLEALRRRVTIMRKEASALRDDLVVSAAGRSDWEARMEMNRWRLRELRTEEVEASQAVASASGSDDRFRSVRSSSRSDVSSAHKKNNLAALRAETETLAREVSVAATQQIALCHSIRRLRAAARLAKLKRTARVAVEARRRLRIEYRSQVLETSAATEAATALRSRARGLRHELACAENGAHLGTAEAGPAGRGDDWRFAEERCAALAGEAEIEAHRTRADSLADTTHEQEYAIMHRQEAELSMRFSSVQANTRVLANALDNAEHTKEALHGELFGLKQRVVSIGASVDSDALARKMLEAELQQQRESTLAWRAYADDLANGHHLISLAATEAVDTCRNAIGMPWTGGGYAGDETPPSHPFPAKNLSAAAALAIRGRGRARLAG